MIIGIDASRAFVTAPTGTENYSTNLIRALLGLSTEHRFVLYLRRSEQGVWVNQKVIDWPYLWTQGGLAWETWAHPPDVLFIPAHTLPVLSNPKVKMVVTIHDLGVEWLPQYHQFPQKFYMTWSTDWAVGHATRIIAVSGATKNDLIKKYNMGSKGIHIVHEAVDHSLFKPVKREAYVSILKKYAIKQPYFLFVGTIQPRKNLVRLIEAFSLFLKDQARFAARRARFAEAAARRALQGVSLVLAGKSGWLNDDIYGTPKRLGIESHVHFIGHVSPVELPTLYSGAEAFVFPSLFEGFGLPILEAFACECPVVTSNTSSMPEVAGDAALFVDPLNTTEISQAMATVLGGKVRDGLVQKGKARVREFTWEKTAKETLKVLEEAASS